MGNKQDWADAHASDKAATEGVAPDASSGSSATAEAGSEADVVTLNTEAADLEFYLAVDVHYHRARQAWFTGLHRWTMFFTILLGTAAAGEVFVAWLSGLLIAAFGAADLCFDFSGRAALHSDLARGYIALARELAAGKDDPDRRSAVLESWIEMSGDAPPVYRAARDMAHNLAIQSLGRDAGARAILSFRKRILAHVWRFEGAA
ncbi:MAG: hypothetical protein WDN46_14095 [Methylocella sp.]